MYGDITMIDKTQYILKDDSNGNENNNFPAGKYKTIVIRSLI